MEERVISTQPYRHSDIENYVMDIDANEVQRWSCEDVITNFMAKTDCDYANELFLANKINGRSLMLLQEEHLKAMGIKAIGGRVYLFQLLTLLKKKVMDLENATPLWSGETPTGGCIYSDNCNDCCRRYACPCCSSRIYWEVSRQGIYNRNIPACEGICGKVTTEFVDYRFLKDLELREERVCCCKRYKLQMCSMPDDREVQPANNAKSSSPVHRVLIHPEAPIIEKLTRNAWNAARLVAERFNFYK